MNRIRGHQEGAESVREVVRTTRELGIPWLTLYAFSEENWRRPRYEVNALMKLLKRFVRAELEEMLQNGIRLQSIGRVHKLPQDVQKVLQEAEKKTASNRDTVLTLALSYGGRQEMTDAITAIVRSAEKGEVTSGSITEELIEKSLYTRGMPDPDLLIRTSGECRVSNFLLWQLAYTEIYLTPTLWPDFRKEEYLKALEEYQRRERRFGATGEQVAGAKGRWEL